MACKQFAELKDATYIPLCDQPKKAEEDLYEDLYNGKYNCAANKCKEELSSEKQTLFLSKITHIMDCECYQFKGKRPSYYEVTIFELETGKYFLYRCYDDKLKPYKELIRKERATVYYQYQCHGLEYITQKPSNQYFNQSELIHRLNFLFTNVFSPNAIIGYKGGDKESYLVKILQKHNNIYCVNLEYFGLEKYVDLLSFYNLKPKNCGYHTKKATTLLYHCSLFECFLFAACLYRKLKYEDRERYVLDMYVKES